MLLQGLLLTLVILGTTWGGPVERSDVSKKTLYYICYGGQYIYFSWVCDAECDCYYCDDEWYYDCSYFSTDKRELKNAGSINARETASGETFGPGKLQLNEKRGKKSDRVGNMVRAVVHG